MRSTIDLARNLGLLRHGRGRRGPGHARAGSADMGCDLAQGYELCRPLPADRCAQAVREASFVLHARLPDRIEGHDVKRLAIAVAALACGLAAAPAASAAPYVVTLEDSVGDVDAAVDGLQRQLGLAAIHAALRQRAEGLRGRPRPRPGGQARPHAGRRLGRARRRGRAPWACRRWRRGRPPRPASAAAAARRPRSRTRRRRPPSPCSTPASTSPTRSSTRVTGVNCVKPGTPAQDDNGHGTNVAGIVAARNTGTGVVGVAPGTRVYAVKVLNNRATGTLSQFLCGINWVAANAAALNIRRREHEHRRRRHERRRLRHDLGRLRAQGDLRRGRRGRHLRRRRPATAARTSRRTVPAAYPEVLTATAITDTDGLPGALGPGLVRQEGARRPHGHLLELRGHGRRRRARRRRAGHVRDLRRPRRQGLDLHRHEPGGAARRGRGRALPRQRRAARDRAPGSRPRR